MRLDSLIRQRFLELAVKSDDITKAKRSEYLQRTGKTLWYAPKPQVVAWGTSVISLFRQVFGAEGFIRNIFRPHTPILVAITLAMKRFSLYSALREKITKAATFLVFMAW